MKKLILVLLSFNCFADSLSRYVDTRIGTASNPTAFKAGTWEQKGNTQPTGAVPFGMIQWGPDTPSRHAGSYIHDDKEILGFSVTHISGPGCPNAGELSILPYDNAKLLKIKPKSFSHDNEKAQAGYYSVKFDDGILAEITSTERTGLGRFTFPENLIPSIVINVKMTNTWKKKGSLNVISPTRLEGWVLGGNFCSTKNKYKTFFAIEFNHPIKSKVALRGVNILKFEQGNPLLMKVGISYVSEKNAWLNLEKENTGWNFAEIKNHAIFKWDRMLETIKISDEVPVTKKRMFYTALYHSLLHPNIFSDVNGEYVGFDNQVHKAQDLNITNFYANFSGWDIYRTQIPLLAFLYPDIASEIIQSYIASGEQCGGLPKWAQNNTETGIMAGDPGPLIIANSYFFGGANFDTEKALNLMKKGALEPGTSCQGYQIRPGSKDYLEMGYVPRNLRGLFRLTEFSNTGQVYVGAASATLEYATTDFAIAQFANKLGDHEAFEKFSKMANNWQNLFDDETQLIRPKYRNGKWQKDVKPETHKGYTEGSAAQYTWTIPYALRELVGRFKSQDYMLSRLDDFLKVLNDWSRTPHLWIGNQPGYGIPWIYYYLGRPDKTQDVLNRIFNETFSDGPEGLPGNDDLGSTSSWYVWASMGLYPGIPGVGGFFISKPIYPEVSIYLQNGYSIKLTTEKSGGYIQSLKWNGRNKSTPWISYNDLKKGGVLKFESGEKPSLWGTDSRNALPSYSDFVLKK